MRQLLIIPAITTILSSLREAGSSTTVIRVLPPVIQTPAEDRFFFDGIVTQPATIVPKLFGDKPFWVPHAFFNLCPFVRGPDIDPVWATGCAPLPFPQMNALGIPQNQQDMLLRLQSLQQQQQQQAQPEDEQPTWWEENRPQGPIDFGMANMYGPIKQEVMYRDYGDGAGGGGGGASARGGGRSRNRQSNSGFWSFWG